VSCKVDCLLDYDFDNSLMTRIAGPMYHRIANTLVDAFVARAARASARVHSGQPHGNDPV